jgi:KaiC/GvpD/RAD55 family RecA-like ATPase
MPNHLTINELDAMTDEDFHVFLDRGRAIVLDASEEQRGEMVNSHEAWVETLDEDLRDGIDWTVETRSDWDLYAELRMNGVEFARVSQTEIAM